MFFLFFFGFVHRPVFWKTVENITFGKLDLFPSSGEGGEYTYSGFWAWLNEFPWYVNVISCSWPSTFYHDIFYNFTCRRVSSLSATFSNKAQMSNCKFTTWKCWAEYTDPGRTKESGIERKIGNDGLQDLFSSFCRLFNDAFSIFLCCC
jgi:hypothetical protein